MNRIDPLGLSAEACNGGGSNNGSLGKEAASVGLDMVPVVGTGKSVVQLITGKDLITGEETSRLMEAGGIALGMIPGGKLLTKGGKLAEGAGTAFKDFNQARNAAVQWLETKGFKAEQPTLGKFGDNAGKPIGMKTADGSVGFRVEYDARNGAHINVWAGKEKGPHFTFEGSQSTVDQIVKQFFK